MCPFWSVGFHHRVHFPARMSRPMLILARSHRDSWGGVLEVLEEHLRVLMPEAALVCDAESAYSHHIEAQVLIPTDARVDATVLDELPRLQLIHQAGAGVDAIDLHAASDRGIRVARVPTAVSGADRAVAEHALGLMLALSRAHASFGRAITDRCLGTPRSASLVGAAIGLVGVGAIGSRLLRLLEPIGARVIAVNGGSHCALQADHLEWVRGPEGLPDLLARADVVVLACPLTRTTAHMIRDETLALCKPGVMIVNVARGGLVDEDAIRRALDCEHVSAFASDVLEAEPADPAHPLVTHPRTLVSPHIAAATQPVVEAIAETIAANIVRANAGSPLRHEVNP